MLHYLPEGAPPVPVLDPGQLRDLTELRRQTETLALRLSLERGGLQWETGLISAHTRWCAHRAGCTAVINGEWRIFRWAFHSALFAARSYKPTLQLTTSLAQATALYKC